MIWISASVGLHLGGLLKLMAAQGRSDFWWMLLHPSFIGENRWLCRGGQQKFDCSGRMFHTIHGGGV